MAEDRPNVGLTVIVLKTADQKSRLMRVLAPLGVLLPSGLGLKIDDTDIGSAGFVRCLPNGCVAEVIMDDGLLKQLRNGQDRDLHHLPDPGRRHRLSDQPERLRRGLRQAALRRLRGNCAIASRFGPLSQYLVARMTALRSLAADTNDLRA